MSPLFAVLGAAAPAEFSRLTMYVPPLVIIAVGMYFLLRELRAGQPSEQPAEAPAPEVPAPAATPEIPLAVIAAAVAAAVDQPHRLVSVSLAPRHLAWSFEGRRQLLTSHQIRR